MNCGLPAHSPIAQTSGTGLQALVDFNVAMTVQFNTGHLEPGPGAVGTTPCRDQDVATLDGLLT